MTDNNIQTLGTIEINGGVISAYRTNGAARIDGSNGGNRTVTINGGIITAESTSSYGSSIGTRQQKTAAVNISGGTIIAKGCTGNAGTCEIGCYINNQRGSVKVTITGGTIQASGGHVAVKDPKTPAPRHSRWRKSPSPRTGDDVLVSGIAGYSTKDIYTQDGVVYVSDSEGSCTYVLALSVELKDYPQTRTYDGTSLENPTAAQIESSSDFSELFFTWYQWGTPLPDPPMDAGTYVLRVQSSAGDNKDFRVTISPRTLEGVGVTVSGTYTYNGGSPNPAVSVVLDGQTLVKDRDYMVSCGSVSAETGTLEITGRGNYSGSTAVAPARPTAELPAAPTRA